MSKHVLLSRGESIMRSFCDKNGLVVPPINVRAPADWRVGPCAYYRPTYIEICLERCAHIGTAGPAWSYPGYAVDRTPYGVISHELGHHADVSRSRRSHTYMGDYSIGIRAKSGEERLTSYCPNDAEWFAEMFRLFVTNPDLLLALRPRTYELLAMDFRPVVTERWSDVLRDAPSRTVTACHKKVHEARRRAGCVQGSRGTR